ncbi:MAG: hypothetical protein QW303_00750 [Nitrososphaerota archaeon]
MNNYKRLKPNLLDPIVEQKIIKTLNPPKEDLWAPAKNSFRNFYQHYIRPNFWIIAIIITVGLLLFYRYRMIKFERENSHIIWNHREKMEQLTCSNLSSKCSQDEHLPQDTKEYDKYARNLLQLYRQQKEEMLEPRISKSSLIKNGESKFAYPLYPYSKNGILVPSASR